MPLYKIARMFIYLYLHTMYDIEYIGKEHLPKNGGAIICANHKSFRDPLLLGAVMNRPIHFMAKNEIFKNKFFTWVLTGLAAFPVNRESVEIESFKRALAILKSGEIMGIFSQATRKSDIDETGGKSGVALFAVKSGAPVIPVGIQGDYRLFSRMAVNMGEALSFAEYEGKKLRTPELAELTRQIMLKVKELA